MLVSFAHWPLWLRVALLAPFAWFIGVVTAGWWPRSPRGWRWFSLTLAAFTLLCVTMICIFHRA